nr:MAG TPA: hypothetical protein [Caudoviricetes sp.]
MKTPCKNCKNCEVRSVGCHGTCVSYIMYKARMDRQSKERNLQCDVGAYIGNNIKRIRTRMRKCKYVIGSNYSE